MDSKHIAKEFIISLDFDGVVAESIDVKKKCAKKWFGVNLSSRNTKEKAFNEFMKKLGKDIIYREFMDRINKGFVREYKIPNKCLPILTKLRNEGFKFVVISSRKSHEYYAVLEFVKKHLNKVVDGIFITETRPKGKIIRKLKARIHIDDDFKKLKQIVAYPVELVYYRQPENYHIDLPFSYRKRIYEAKNWEKIYQIIYYIKELYEAICWKNDWKNADDMINRIYSYKKKLNKRRLKKLLQEYKSSVAFS